MSATIAAGLRLLRDTLPLDSALRERLSLLALEVEQDAPPWNPESGPAAERMWAGVIPGDKVLAPNGTWYRVDSVARTGEQIVAMLDGKIRSVRRTDEMVKVERGDAGRAVDVFAAGGLTLEPIKSGVDA